MRTGSTPACRAHSTAIWTMTESRGWSTAYAAACAQVGEGQRVCRLHPRVVCLLLERLNCRLMTMKVNLCGATAVKHEAVSALLRMPIWHLLKQVAHLLSAAAAAALQSLCL